MKQLVGKAKMVQTNAGSDDSIAVSVVFDTELFNAESDKDVLLPDHNPNSV